MTALTAVPAQFLAIARPDEIVPRFLVGRW